MLRERTSALNKMAPQCPVNLLTLHFRDGGLVPSEDIPEDRMREPWVYQECGHVFGQHDWNDAVTSNKEGDNGNRKCPMCRKVWNMWKGIMTSILYNASEQVLLSFFAWKVI